MRRYMRLYLGERLLGCDMLDMGVFGVRTLI